MTAIPSFPEFSPLALHHQAAIESYTRIFPPYSDYTFPSLWSWNIQEKIEVSVLNGNLVVRFTDYLTNEKFLSFLGSKEVNETLEALFALIEDAPDHLGYLKLIPEHNLQGIRLNDAYEVVEDHDNHDYVYSIQELVSLSGSKYQKRRNKIQQFLKKYQWQAAELNLSCARTCRDMESLCETWTKRQLLKNNDVQNDIDALKRLTQATDKICLSGVGVYVDGVLAGYALNEFNHHQFATNLFEHADINYAGVFTFLRKQVASRLQKDGYLYLNHQQDLGIEGLRKSKRVFRPAFFLKKFIIRRAGKTASDT